MTTTMNKSCCRKLFGKPVIKSILIVSHFHSGMGSGYNNPVGCWCSALTCWHSRQRDKYYATSFFMFGQKKSFFIMVIIFRYLGCPEYSCLWSSFITVSLIYVMFGMYILFLCNNNPFFFRLKYVFTWFCSFLAYFSFKIWYSLCEFSALRILC